MTNLERSLIVIIKPSAKCGVCGGSEGTYSDDGAVLLHELGGAKKAHVFLFDCASPSCGAHCGVTTCSLKVGTDEPPRHVLSLDVTKSRYFCPNRKPHERQDQRIAYDRALFENYENDAVTIKSFDGYTERHNLTCGYTNARAEVKLVGTPLHVATFRNAWFLCRAWEKGQAVGLPPSNCLDFSKRELDGDGCFERYLERVNPLASHEFEVKWCRHSDDECKVEHKVTVIDGHAKLHTECCTNKNATTVNHPALGPVHLACGKWPMYISGKKQLLCAQCCLSGIAKEGAGSSISPSSAKDGDATEVDEFDIPELKIGDSDLDLVGETWFDPEDRVTYVLLGVTWLCLDSNDGERTPQHIALYAPEGDELCTLVGADAKSIWAKNPEWSRMSEVRTWIAHEKRGKKAPKAEGSTNPTSARVGLTDRAARALRRNAMRADEHKKQALKDETSRKHNPVAPGAGSAVMGGAGSAVGLSMAEDEWALEDIHSRIVLPDGSIKYEVSYVVQSTKVVRIWESASVVPVAAVERWESRRKSFRYTDEELELMKRCAGSLKENQPGVVSTTAGILAVILNCGIIVSIMPLLGTESLSQVYMHMIALYDRNRDYMPLCLAYDDGCHLRRFAELRQHTSTLTKWFWELIGIKIVVDRFHWRNHKSTHGYCREHCNPHENEEIKEANTEVCEQSFRWFARHKYSLNHMTPARFLFFLIVIADRRNAILISKR